MNDVEIGYAAGLFDGEGSISIVRRPTGYMVLAQISMQDGKVLQWFSNRFGGRVGKYKPSAYSFSTKHIYKWAVWGNNAQSFLNKVVPYLIEKKLQAEIALAFPVGKQGCNKLSEDEHFLRESLYEEIKLVKDRN